MPRVERPLDTTRFKQDPCAVLTPAQVTGLIGANSHVRPDPHGPGGPGCGWFSRANIVIIFPDIDQSGLTSVYRGYPFLLPLEPVEGYPAAAYGLDDERARYHECNLALGTSDRETLRVAIRQSPEHAGETDPCQSARDVAAHALDTLRRG